MTMIPGSYELRPRGGSAPEPAATAPASADTGGSSTPKPAVARAQFPVWIRVALFAALLLAATWLAMFVKSLAR